MTTKHTPGPWRWVSRGRYWELVGPNDECIWDDGSAWGEYSQAIDPDSPNGRLVAAAPELLEACRAIIAFIDAPEAPGDIQTFEMIEAQARAAVAKAEGGVAP